jgi:hypothetical protein
MEAPKMTIYKVINDKNNTVAEYYLQRDKAQQSVRDMMLWFAESFHIESQVFDDAATN